MRFGEPFRHIVGQHVIRLALGVNVLALCALLIADILFYFHKKSPLSFNIHYEYMRQWGDLLFNSEFRILILHSAF